MSARQDLHQPVESLGRLENLDEFVVDELGDEEGTPPTPLHLDLLTYASEGALDLSHPQEAEVRMVVESSSHINEGAISWTQLLAEAREEVAMSV